MRFFLDDLGHNLLTYSSDTYPLGTANVASYPKAHLDYPLQIDSVYDIESWTGDNYSKPLHQYKSEKRTLIAGVENE